MYARRTFPGLMSSTDAGALPVLFRDAHLVVVNKPPGISVQPDRTGDPCLLGQVQAMFPGAAVGSPHRLDRPVGGITLFTLDATTLRAMDTLFRDRQVAKTYLAIVEGHTPAQGFLEHNLKHPAGSRKAIAEAATQGWAESATLQFTTRAKGDRYSLLEVVPQGGAFHQIRVQLAASGHPIKGDVKYGARRGEPDRSIALHAWRLVFKHPGTGALLALEAPPPESPIWRALRGL